MKRLVFLLVLALGCGGALGESAKYALVIGIAGYPHFNPNLQLKYAGSDAEKFAAFIETPEGGSFPAGNVHLVTNANATRDRIYDEFTWLESHVGADDVVYVYFAGHGDKYKDKSYFMPYDASPSRPDDRGIAMDDFYKKVTTDLQARQVVVFVDACHAAGADSGRMGAADGENGKNAWDALNRKAGQVTMGFFSSASNEDSYEDDEFRQGLFTHYLLDGLRGAAKSTSDGYISSGNLYDFVEDAVAVRSRKKFPDQQTPQKSHEFSSGYRLAKVRMAIVTAGDETTHYAAGNALALNGNWTDAIAQFNEAIRIKPDYAQAHDYLGVALTWKDDWQGAINEYSKAMTLNPNIQGISGRLASAYYNYGESLATKKNWDGAMVQYKQALQLNPSYPEALLAIGDALTWKDDWQGAMDQYNQALKLKPDLPGGKDKLAGAYYGYGIELAKQKNWDGAISNYRQALSLRPNYPAVYQSLGRALTWKDDWKGAKEQYTLAMQMKPDLPGLTDDLAHADCNYGYGLANEKNWDAAIPEYRAAVQLKPDYAEAHHYLGVALAWKDDWKGSVDEYTEALRLKPDLAGVKDKLADALYMDSRTLTTNKRYDDAIAELQKAVQMKPDYPEAYQAWGANLTWKADWQGAADKYRQSLKRKPDNPSLHNDLGKILEYLGDKAGALAEYRAATTAVPSDATFRANYDRLNGTVSSR